MRRLVVALAALVIAVSLAGCGGGEEAPPPEGTPAEAPPPAPGAGSVVAIPDRSRPETAQVFEAFPTAQGLPAAVTDRIADQQPMVLLFVDGSQEVADDVRAAVDDAMEANGGAIDLVVYDLGKYVTIDASGQVIADLEGLAEGSKGAQAASLAVALGVNATPYIVFTDDQGYVVFRHRGLADAEFLESHMERLVD